MDPTATWHEGAEEVLGSIGPYKLLALLGSGGMGDVYLAEQEKPMRRRVAIKVIKRGMDSKEVVARFESERQALALMTHPGIARVFEAGSTEEGRPFFVMEHVPGVWITEYCDRHGLDGRARLELFHEVCQAIQHAHQKGIIHRDIKPSNILVSLEEGRPRAKVIDFGVAKAVSQRLTEKTLFTKHGVLVGTPGYVSPEQADATGLDVDIRTDIYSLGVVLYELLAGSPPFDPTRLRGRLAEMRRIIREEAAAAGARVAGLGATATDVARRRDGPGTLRRRLRGDLDWIALRPREGSPRYQSATELAADVQRYLHDEPVMAGPPTLGYRLGKAVRRHKVAVAAASAVLVAVVGGLVASTALYVQAEAARAEAQAKTDTGPRADCAGTDPTRHRRGSSTTRRARRDGARPRSWPPTPVARASPSACCRGTRPVYGLAFLPDGRTRRRAPWTGDPPVGRGQRSDGSSPAATGTSTPCRCLPTEGTSRPRRTVSASGGPRAEGAWYDSGGRRLAFRRRPRADRGKGRLTILDVREGRIAFQQPSRPTEAGVAAVHQAGPRSRCPRRRRSSL
jgi:tRNA A-37 threonylcarbamoyl transferase component Bud32